MGDTNNKTIAKNTLFLYFRTLFMMCISLYTSRVVLAVLGIEDYGINNVVAGVVSMLSFLNGTMSSSTQRYMTYSIGKSDILGTAKVLCIAKKIHLYIGIIVVLVCETIGLWFLNTELVIPSERLFASNCVYQFAIFSFFVNITQVPYNAAIIAHEKMEIFAYISILEVVCKLLIVYLLCIIPYDHLIVYSVLGFLVSQIVRILYRIYCKRHFDEFRMKSENDSTLLKEMSSFAGWNFFGSLAWMLKDQGLNILLNLFCGPVANAARGVSYQVSNAVLTFVNNFSTAVTPQITKNFSQNKIVETEKLTYRGSKFSFYLLFLLAFPLIMNIDFVLELWLKEVPYYTNVFVTLILVDAMINAIFGKTMMTAMMSTGHIKYYQIVVSLIMICIVPVSYIVLKLGYDVTFVFLILVISSLLSGLSRFYFCVRQIGFSVSRFISSVIIPILLILLIVLPISNLIDHKIIISSKWENFIVKSCLYVMIIAVSVCFVGFDRNEKTSIKNCLLHKIHTK